MPLIRNPRVNAAASVAAELGVTPAALTTARIAVIAHLDAQAASRLVERDPIVALPEVQALPVAARERAVNQILAELG